MNPVLDLSNLRPKLAMMEDSLIFALFERAKFALNPAIYDGQSLRVPTFQPANQSDFFPLLTAGDIAPSLFEVILKETERLHALLGRFQHPEEYPFSEGLPAPVLRRDYGPRPIRQVGLNWNSKIREAYLKAVTQFCMPGDDKHYGSAAVCDVNCLFALSHRIHFGQYIAESKVQSDPGYVDLIATGDRGSILTRLTNSAVEAQVLERVKQKGERYGFNPDFIASFYREQIIPMTKEVEVEYLIRRGAD